MGDLAAPGEQIETKLVGNTADQVIEVGLEQEVTTGHEQVPLGYPFESVKLPRSSSREWPLFARQFIDLCLSTRLTA